LDGKFDEFLDHFGSFWVILDHFGSFLMMSMNSALPFGTFGAGIQHLSRHTPHHPHLFFSRLRTGPSLGNHLSLGIFPDGWMKQLVNLTGMQASPGRQCPTNFRIVIGGWHEKSTIVNRPCPLSSIKFSCKLLSMVIQ
jgi:hypothetical protein